MPQSTSTVSSAEAESKRDAALEAVEARGFDALLATSPATVRWLLCGRGRPVSTSSPAADYTVLLTSGRSYVLFPDIETSRVLTEERFEELGFESVAFPWHEGPDATLAELGGDARLARDGDLEPELAPLRRELREEELERFRAAGSDAAEAMVDTLGRLDRGERELDAAAELAGQCRRRGFFPPVVLVAGEARQRVHRHPLPTEAPLGAHALLAVTAEREGLHVSLTRLVSFGPAPKRLEELVCVVAAVDAAMLRASRPGARAQDVLEVAAAEYERQGFPDEWRRHHQGGITGYKGREVFATPQERTPLPRSGAVAWNPSIAGGAKSEDTALVTEQGLEVITRTPGLAELDVDGLTRPAVTEL